MLDLIVLLDGKSYYNRNEIKDIFGLSHQLDNRGMENYCYEGKSSGEHCFFFFTDDIYNGDYYAKEELEKVPYDVCGICHLAFYPPDIMPEILSSLIEWNDELYVDNDNKLIINIREYYELAKHKKIYPYNCLPKGKRK